MDIETFETTEVTDQGVDFAPEQIALIEELDLGGQRGLISADQTEVAPYRQMTLEEIQVYCLVTPEITPVEQYRGEAIPLRVLQVLAHAKSLGIYAKFEIWAKASVDVKDPVLVGRMHQQYHWEPPKSEDTHILARWGEELEPFPVLKEKAKQIHGENLKQGYRNMIKFAGNLIEDIDAGQFELGDTVRAHF